jgi:hypothetical protein
MRKLASIRTIKEIREIPNADTIEVAIIDGWEVVIKKAEFKVGDKCIYIEIDSLVPSSNPAFDFLASRKYRVRTIRLRKQVSQGIAFPLSTLGIEENIEEGTDVTERLNIVKYDPERNVENLLLDEETKKNNAVHKYLLRYKWYRHLWTKKKSWPEFVVKTDEERIQNVPSIIERYADATFYETEKLDGQSATYFWAKCPSFLNIKTWLFGVCSRNIWLKTPTNNNYWKIAKKYDIKNKLKQLGKQLVIQGEIIGDGIQSNKYGLSPGELDFYVYNIYNVATDEWYGEAGIRLHCAALGLKTVPLIDIKKLSEFGRTVPELVSYVTRSSKLVERQQEGSVFREILTSKGKRGISFKCINPQFLLGLKEDE